VTWRTFCSSINDQPRSARLHRAVSRDPKVAPSGGRTQSEGETLDLLLRMHFPNSEAMEGEVALATASLLISGLAGGDKGCHLWKSCMGN
jgi:hypothetical protein